jgi:hypothetical protein
MVAVPAMLAATVLAATVLAVPTAAGAASHTIPWHRYRTAPWRDAPGEVCMFGVSAKPVRDGEQTRILARYPRMAPVPEPLREGATRIRTPRRSG